MSQRVSSRQSSRNGQRTHRLPSSSSPALSQASPREKDDEPRGARNPSAVRSFIALSFFAIMWGFRAAMGGDGAPHRPRFGKGDARDGMPRAGRAFFESAFPVSRTAFLLALVLAVPRPDWGIGPGHPHAGSDARRPRQRRRSPPIASGREDFPKAASGETPLGKSASACFRAEGRSARSLRPKGRRRDRPPSPAAPPRG